VLAGEHGPLRRAMAGVGARARTAGPRLSLASALAHVEAGDFSAAQSDVRHAQRIWPAEATADLAVLLAVAEQFGAGAVDANARVIGDIDELPSEPDLEALARLSRGNVQLAHDDPARARVEFGAALALSRRHAYDYLEMQCLALLGIVAANTGDLRTMRKVGAEALVIAADHGWEGSLWSGAATVMVGSSDLLGCEPVAAERRTADALAAGLAGSTPPLRFMLRAVHGAAVFDLGDRAAGLAELQQARLEFGDEPAPAEQCGAAAMLEFRAALMLGHSAAARTVFTWLTQRTGDSAEALVMQAWADAAGGRPEQARTLIRTVLDGAAPMLVPYTAVDAWLLETSMALAVGERPAARHALRTALRTAELLGTVRPFAHSGPDVRGLMVHQHGSFGASDAFADRALAVGAGRELQMTTLSAREITVLGLLPSLLSLDEIAVDLTVSVNTVKSHVRSIYAKLGVSSRRLAVLAAHERGLLHTSVH
jgi:LuxR family maltose regulon positive regulatory protein